MTKQVKSRERVAEHGEVFTAEREVNAMLDLVKQETERVDSRFLEPACGDGNFVAEILRRKLEAAKKRAIPPRKKKPLPLEFEKQSVTAVASIYGVDLLIDNVIACRQRLYDKPIYNLFVEQAKKLNPRFLCMIIPSRWFAGGLGLDNFRQAMMEDEHITHLVDYTNAKDCFPQNSISGGVCYFLRERDTTGLCEFTNINGNKITTESRSLSEFPVVVRYNSAVDIIRKVREKATAFLKDEVSPISPFAIPTKVTGEARPTARCNITLYTSRGVGYINKSEILSNIKYLDKYKVMVSQIGAEHAGEPGRDGKFRVLTSSMRVMEPNEVCTNSYIVIGEYTDPDTASNVLAYLKTKFVRFLVLQAVSSIHISRTSFTFVPMVDFSKQWTDEELYAEFGITPEEIEFIDSMIKPMDGGDE